MADKELNVIIRARNELAAGMKSAQSSLKTFAQKASAATGGSVDKTLKLLGVVGKLEVGLKGLQVATAAWKGDAEEVNRIMASMPFGIGPVWTAVRGIALEWSGIADKVKEINEELARNNKTYQKNLKLLNEEKAARAGIADLEEQNRLDEMSPEKRRAQQRAQKVHELFEPARSERTGLLTKDMQRRKERLLADIRADFAKERDKAADKSQKEEKKAAESLNRLRSQIAQRTLQAAGEQFKAQLAGIRESYRQQIAATEDGEKLKLLARMRGLDMEAAIQAEAKRRMGEAGGGAQVAGGVSAIRLTERFQGLAVRRQATEQQKGLDEQKKQTAKLDEISEQLRAIALSGESDLVISGAA